MLTLTVAGGVWYFRRGAEDAQEAAITGRRFRPLRRALRSRHEWTNWFAECQTKSVPKWAKTAQTTPHRREHRAVTSVELGLVQASLDSPLAFRSSSS